MSGQRPRVLIVELDGLGHRFYHVRSLARRALEAGAQVVVLTRDHEESREHLRLHLSGLLPQVEVIEVAEPSWNAVERIATDLEADLTVVSEADNWLLPLLARRGWQAPGVLSLLVMRARVTRSTGRSRWLAAAAVKAVVVSVLPLLPRVHLRVLRSQLWHGRSLWAGVHDPVGLCCSAEDVSQVRKGWRLDPDRTWIGVIGAVTPNKNLELVTEAVCLAAQRDPGRYGLLVAGRIAPEVRALLPRLEARLETANVPTRVVDRLLEDHELDAALTAIDCLALAYELNAPSGTFGKALGAGTRVVSAGSPALRRDTGAAPGMALWSPLTADAIAANLVTSAALGPGRALRLPDENTFADALLLR